MSIVQDGAIYTELEYIHLVNLMSRSIRQTEESRVVPPENVVRRIRELFMKKKSD